MSLPSTSLDILKCSQLWLRRFKRGLHVHACRPSTWWCSFRRHVSATDASSILEDVDSCFQTPSSLSPSRRRITQVTFHFDTTDDSATALQLLFPFFGAASGETSEFEIVVADCAGEILALACVKYQVNGDFSDSSFCEVSVFVFLVTSNSSFPVISQFHRDLHIPLWTESAKCFCHP